MNVHIDIEGSTKEWSSQIELHGQIIDFLSRPDPYSLLSNIN